MPHSFAQLKHAIASEPPDLAVILGSGLSALTQHLHITSSVSYRDIPEMPSTSVVGHEGRLVFGRWVGKHILVFQGRFHHYEGHPWETVLRPIYLVHELGAQKFLVTNAAGGIRDDLQPGSVMLLDGTLDWTRPKCWRAEPKRNLFCPSLSARMQEAARRISMPLPTGVYAQVVGPCYETPAEIRALRTCGADAVGMSTVREVTAANDLGMSCAGLSLITNRAAGLSCGPLSHDEVLATAARQKDRLTALLNQFIERC